MKLQLKNSLIEYILIYLLFLTFAIFIINSFGLTMPDDGWRHLAMALYPEEVQSWQRIFPDSLYTDFDPWFMWHNLLFFISKFVDNSNIHIIINSVVYSFLSFWYYLALTKFTKMNKLLLLIFSIGLPMLNVRYFFLRPDILSGLFILYFLIINNKSFLVLISIIYPPFYYVFWFYLTYLSFITLILKEYKKTLILILSLIFGFLFYSAYDFGGFIHISNNVLNNDLLTKGYTVGENKPILIPLSLKNSLGSTLLLIYLTIFSILLFFIFKPKNPIYKYTILFLPLIIIQYRFFQLLQPIIFICVINILYISYKIIEKHSLNYFLDLIKTYFIENTYFHKLGIKSIKILFTTAIIIYFLFTFISTKNEFNEIKQLYINNSFFKNDEFKNKKILITTMSTSMYMATFFNPSGSYIPNCSVGWINYNEKNKKTYFDLLINNKEIIMKDFFIFLNRISPDYLIIETSKTSNLRFSKELIENNGYMFYKIINSKLIFRKI